MFCLFSSGAIKGWLYGLSRNYSFENILNLSSSVVIDGSNIVSFFCYIRHENSNYGSLNIEVIYSEDKQKPEDIY